jgi:hypothetical protein
MIKNRVSWCKITIKVGIVTASILSVVRPANALLLNSFQYTDVYGNIDTNGDVDWNQTGGTAPGGTITGTIAFDESLLDSNLSGTNIPATSFVINSVPSYFQSIWQNTNFDIGNNLVGLGNSASNAFNRTYDYFSGATTGTSYTPSNSFTLTNGVITDFKFEERYYLGVSEPNNSNNEQYEWVVLGGAENENSIEDSTYDPDGIFPGNWLEIAYPLASPLSPPSGTAGIEYADVFVYDVDTITFAAVPFEFSPGFGLLTMGGLWGISRLRKANAKNKNEKVILPNS